MCAMIHLMWQGSPSSVTVDILPVVGGKAPGVKLTILEVCCLVLPLYLKVIHSSAGNIMSQLPSIQVRSGKVLKFVLG